jgi:hypothetical protein
MATALSNSNVFPLRITRSLPVPFSMLVLSLLTLCALFSYGYSLRVAISHAVERESVMEEISLIRGSIASLDRQYAELVGDLSLERAKSLGFHEVADPLYISVSAAPEAMGLRSR